MTEFATVIEVWFDASDEDSANDLVKRLAADVIGVEAVRMVEASGAEEV